MGRSRVLEGLPESRIAVLGNMPSEPIQVPMNDAIYFADVAGGQKTGLFYDQRANQIFVKNLAQSKKVLDVFSHVGGFGLAAMAGGASEVTCIDGSQPALDLAMMGAEATNPNANFKILKADAFDAMIGLATKSAIFDIVVCDPPAFAPQKS